MLKMKTPDIVFPPKFVRHLKLQILNGILHDLNSIDLEQLDDLTSMELDTVIGCVDEILAAIRHQKVTML